MKLHVFMSPADVLAVKPALTTIYIIIDVIRATTSMVTILDRGARKILAADTVEQARISAGLVNGRLLCGERNVHPLPGFDYGNSPVAFSQAPLREREVILTTTNGTRAFYACPENATRLAGCFYNAEAVTKYALNRAYKQQNDIALVCAAEAGYFALDDAACAGYLALELIKQYAGIQPQESVTAAITLAQMYPPAKLPKYCHSAQQVIAGGLPEDIALCMSTNKSHTVPRVQGQEIQTGLLIIEKTT